MICNLKSYPTTVLNERMWHFRGSKHTLTPPTYFQGARTPSTPWSTLLVATAQLRTILCQRKYIDQSHARVGRDVIKPGGSRSSTWASLQEGSERYSQIVRIHEYRWGCGYRLQWQKNAQRRRKHCALAVVKQSQKFSPRRRPGGAGWPKFNQLQMVTWRVIQQQFWMKECDILYFRGQNILWPFLHIFRGSGSLNPFTYEPSFVRIDACNFELSW